MARTSSVGVGGRRGRSWAGGALEDDEVGDRDDDRGRHAAHREQGSLAAVAGAIDCLAQRAPDRLGARQLVHSERLRIATVERCDSSAKSNQV
jgi:hypothetical protein